MYQHKNWGGALLDFPVNKVVCVGSNYRDHIKEMGSETPTEPLLFIKPETALCDIRQPIIIPQGLGSLHHEIELAVLIGRPLKAVNENSVEHAIAGYAVALDLTLRELQAKLKKAGQPWEKAKAFDGSCPISGFIPATNFYAAQQVTLSLEVNDELRQQGNTQDMITPIFSLISYISKFFTLRAGDIVLTGTPHGVGPLKSGDRLIVGLHNHTLSTYVL